MFKRNKHHLIPHSRGGSKIESNLLLIKMYRHNKWHILYKNRTLKEIIHLLKSISPAKFKKPPQWKVLWGNKSLQQVIALLIRVQRAKNHQAKRFLIN